MPSESLFTSCRHCGKQTTVSASKCSHCGKKIKKLTLVHWVGIVFVSLVIIGNLNPHRTPTPAKPVVVSTTDLKKHVFDSLKLESTWKRGGLGLVMEADLRIANNSLSDIKDVAIQCEHYAKSGTKIDSNVRDIYDVFKAGTSRTYTDFNMGFMHEQAVKSSCSIKDFSLVK